MAINRQDYQYIRNTIPGQQNKKSDSSLGIGEKISNIVVDLNQTNVHNSFYEEYYSEKPENKVWDCVYTTGTEYESTVSKTFSKSDSGVVEFKENVAISNNIYYSTPVSTTEGLTGIVQYTFREDLSLYVTDSETKFWSYEFSDTVGLVQETMDWSSGILTVTCSSLKAGVKLIMSLPSGYGNKMTVKILATDIAPSVVGDNTITKITVTGSQVLNSSYDGTYLTIYFAGSADSFSASITLYYTGVSYESTIKDGMLKTITVLEPNTSYVLQIIDAVQTQSTITEQNSITWQGWQSVSFNNYLFFNTGSLGESKNTTLKINGISFGYKIYAPINGDVCELRSIVSPVEAKVFLFKSDLPWFVDKQGTIIGLHDTPLKMMTSTSSSALSPYLTESELINIFSNKPNLTISNADDKQTLKVLLPDAVDSSNTWKHYTLWNKTKTNGKTPLIEKMRLIVYRDFLVPTLRDYNHQSITQSKGIIRGIQCTNKSVDDPYTKWTKEIDSISILFNQPKLNINSSTTSINFDFIPGEEEKFKKYIKTAENKMDAVEEMSLAALSLLGYNFQYSVNNDLFTQEDANLPYRYTSICFAWGYQEGNSLKRISDFSEPVLLDRDAVSMTYSDNEYTLTLKDCSLSKGILIPYYYTHEIINLTK